MIANKNLILVYIMARTRRVHRKKHSKRGGMFGPMKTAKRLLASARASAAPYSAGPSFADRAFNEWHNELMSAIGNAEAEEKMRAKGAEMLSAMLEKNPGLMEMIEEGMSMDKVGGRKGKHGKRGGARQNQEEPVEGCGGFQTLLGLIGAAAVMSGAFYILNYLAPSDMDMLAQSSKRNLEDLAAGFLSGLNSAIRLRDLAVWQAVWNNMSGFLQYVGADTLATAAVNAKQGKDAKVPSISASAAMGVMSWWCKRFPTLEQFGTGVSYAAYPVTGSIRFLWRSMKKRMEASTEASATTAEVRAADSTQRPIPTFDGDENKPEHSGGRKSKRHGRKGKKHGGKSKRHGRKGKKHGGAVLF